MANPGPGPVVANNQNPDPLQAAMYRAVAAFIALVFVVGVLIYFPSLDPTVKVLLIGLGGAAVLGVEEFFKSQKGL